MSQLFLFSAALIFSSLGCKDSGRAGPRVQAELLQGDTSAHVLPSDDRNLVLRARAFDRANQRDSARALYEAAAGKLPGIADWLYLRAAGVTADSSARARYYGLVKSVVGRDRIGPTEAVARERTGDIAGAIRQYSAVGARVSALRLRLSPGISDADRAAARADLLSYIAKPPGSEEARDAVGLFDQLIPTRTPQEELALARAASGSGSFQRAALGYSRALQAGLGTSRDRFHYGIALGRLNKDAEAAKQLAKVTSPGPLAAAAQYQRARALVATGNVAGARLVLRSLNAAHPRDSSSASGLLLLSDLATDEGRDDAARTTLLSLIKQFSTGRQAAIARFRAAMIAFIGRDYHAAAAEMDALANRDPGSAETDAAIYWAGKALAALGDSTRAREHWRVLLAKDPLGYYAVMAAKKLDTAVLSLSQPPSPAPAVPAVDSAVSRVATLKDVGMETEAGFEYAHLYRNATSSPARLLATARALSGTEESERSIALGKKALDQIGRTPDNYRLYFPVVERETIIRSSKENGLDPAVVVSLIRQESGFNPRATSGAGARGLMQLLPGVGRSIAETKGIGPWDPDMLYRAAINIQLGTAHLSGLFREYPEIVRVLAAYNAGESRVTKWAAKQGSADPEVFTERIPFVETRDYVRAVLRNRAFYGALYPW